MKTYLTKQLKECLAFSRHENNKAEHYDKKESDGGYSAFRISWDLWGGNSAYSWSKRLVEKMKNEDRAMPDALKVGDFVSWNSAGGRAKRKDNKNCKRWKNKYT